MFYVLLSGMRYTVADWTELSHKISIIQMQCIAQMVCSGVKDSDRTITLSTLMVRNGMENACIGIQ